MMFNLVSTLVMQVWILLNSLREKKPLVLYVNVKVVWILPQNVPSDITI